MTEQQHPITPSPELIAKWQNHIFGYCDAARWGYEQRGAVNEAELQKARDEELEACCEWLNFYAADVDARDLRTARRPKPPSLKEQKQAIHAEIHQLLARISANNEGTLPNAFLRGAVAEPIRRALERLQELEGEQ